MAKVAFLGLGVMGFPMAGHLVKKGGHEVTVFNRTAAKAKSWAEQFGGKTASTPKAAAEGQYPTAEGQLIKLADLRGALPQGTKWVTAQERATQLTERRASFDLRYEL